MHLHLAELSSDLPLASGWGDAQLVQDELDLGALRVARAGLMSRRVDGMEVTGSAAACDEAPLRRAWLELVERTAIVDAAQRETPDSSSRRRAQSSGVAAAPSWDQACERACLELAERDVVLRSWYGEIRPVQASVPPILASIPRYDWAARLLPGPR